MLPSHSCVFPHSQSLSTPHNSSNLHKFHQTKHTKPPTFKLTCQSLSLDNIAHVIHNKVLIAASVSSAIGQLSKPFTNSIVYKKDFDFKAASQSGGFPSSHSSAVVAAATALGIERGFSDSVFSLAVVYAALVMYDAQGVRREVGNHAKVINRTLLPNQANPLPPRGKDNQVNSNSGTSSFPDLDMSTKKTNPPMPRTTTSSVSLNSNGNIRKTAQELQSSGLEIDTKGAETGAKSLLPLKESVGHTEIEVIAGAVLGFTVSLVVYTIM